MLLKYYRSQLSPSALSSWNGTKIKCRLLQRGIRKLKRLIVFERRTSFERLSSASGCVFSFSNKSNNWLFKQEKKSEPAAVYMQRVSVTRLPSFSGVVDKSDTSFYRSIMSAKINHRSLILDRGSCPLRWIFSYSGWNTTFIFLFMIRLPVSWFISHSSSFKRTPRPIKHVQVICWPLFLRLFNIIAFRVIKVSRRFQNGKRISKWRNT